MPMIVSEMSIFDQTRLLETCGGDAAFCGFVLDEFVRSGWTTLQQVREEMGRGDADGVYHGLHSLKGSARTVGAEEIGDVAARLEARVHEFGLQGLESGLEELERAWERFITFVDDRREAA